MNIRYTIGKNEYKRMTTNELRDAFLVDLLALPGKLPFTACVDARDLKDGHIGDFMHYNTAAQEVIGGRFAEAVNTIRVE